MNETFDPYSLEESYPNCPVIVQFEILLRSLEASLDALQQFQRTIINCRICSEITNCELIEEMNFQIDTEITEIVEEWGW